MDRGSGLLGGLVREALDLGASGAGVIPAEAVRVDDRFAEMCRPPRCPDYGLSANCPPHVMPPAEFRESLGRYRHALVFKIDVPTEVLLGDDRSEVARLIHEMAAHLERSAIGSGCRAKGLAAGSCKRLFCDDDARCPALEEGGECPYPDRARPSLSGVGVDFRALCDALGWQASAITKDSDPDAVPTGMMAGVVLIG